MSCYIELGSSPPRSQGANVNNQDRKCISSRSWWIEASGRRRSRTWFESPQHKRAYPSVQGSLIKYDLVLTLITVENIRSVSVIVTVTVHEDTGSKVSPPSSPFFKQNRTAQPCGNRQTTLPGPDHAFVKIHCSFLRQTKPSPPVYIQTVVVRNSGFFCFVHRQQSNNVSLDKKAATRRGEPVVRNRKLVEAIGLQVHRKAVDVQPVGVIWPVRAWEPWAMLQP